MALDLSQLNNEQREAVVHEKGPLLIVAGAGTGKTTVITYRIAYLIEKGLAKPENILAVTFTEKAASEMEERVDKLLEIGYMDFWISTFHSFAERVLKDYGIDIGIPTSFKVVDTNGVQFLIRKNFEKFRFNYYRPLGNPVGFIRSLVSHFSHCKDQEIYPEDYLKYAEKLKTRDDVPESQEIERIKEIAEAYDIYQKILLENNCLDFGDLINYTLKLFRNRPHILKEYHEKFKYILVDEFQDTNWAQYELIKLLAQPENNLTVCADDDQAIYRWRGASFSNIIQFVKDYPEAKQVSLTKNYRSTQNILDKAYHFIVQNNPDRLEYVNKINKKLVAENKGEGIIEHLHARDLDEEARLVVKKILELLKEDKEASYGDFAILVRANNSALPFIKVLERAGLPYQFFASRGLYSKPIILDVISYFKLLDNYHESLAVYRLLNLPFLKIPPGDIALITHYSQKKSKSLFEALNELTLINGISNATHQKIGFLLSLIEKHSQAAKEKNVSEIFLSFLEDSGYLAHLVKHDDTEKIDLLNQFYKKIKSFEENTVDASVKNFVEDINLEIEFGEEGKLENDIEEGPDVVKVMTIHGAKGLEFKYVFVTGMVDKRFPTIERREPIELAKELIKDIKPEGDVHLQEERRLFYVAMTRAKRGLFFTSADDYGGERKKKISRFLAELGYQVPERRNIEKTNALKEEKIKSIQTKNIKLEYLPRHFSYSQLVAYEKCPLQYKFSFILKIPIKGKPFFSFGKTLHNTLHQFLLLYLNRSNRVQQDLFGTTETFNQNLSFEDLKEIFEKNWINEWYESKKQQEEYYQLGKKIIKDFYEEFEKQKPKVLKIDNNWALELPFNFRLGENVIYGVIDRIDEGNDGLVIIDYKTGKTKEKLTAEEKEQLLIYQLALENILPFRIESLVYYYLEENKKISFLGSSKDLEKLKGKIEEVIQKIKTGEFKPTPGYHCQTCDFKEICQFAQRKF